MSNSLLLHRFALHDSTQRCATTHAQQHARSPPPPAFSLERHGSKHDVRPVRRPLQQNGQRLVQRRAPTVPQVVEGHVHSAKQVLGHTTQVRVVDGDGDPALCDSHGRREGSTQCVVVAQVSRLAFVRFKFGIPPTCPCCLPAFPRRTRVTLSSSDTHAHTTALRDPKATRYNDFAHDKATSHTNTCFSRSCLAPNWNRLVLHTGSNVLSTTSVLYSSFPHVRIWRGVSGRRQRCNGVGGHSNDSKEVGNQP